MSIDSEHIGEALEQSIRAKQNENKAASIECHADELKFKCVWQQPVASIQTINQFMEQINIYDDTNEFGDQTPSNLTALLSSSFPSGVGDDEKSNEDEDQLNFSVFFAASTPCVKLANERQSTTRKRDRQVIKDFNDTSPVLYSSRKALTRDLRVLNRKRLQMSFNFDEEFQGKDLKILKMWTDLEECKQRFC